MLTGRLLRSFPVRHFRSLPVMQLPVTSGDFRSLPVTSFPVTSLFLTAPPQIRFELWPYTTDVEWLWFRPYILIIIIYKVELCKHEN
jgi:hypothetical protein